MAKLTKRAKAIAEKVTAGKQYPLDEALGLLKQLSGVKFKESVDVSVNLGIDARKSDQAVRGATVLPNGTGKTVRVAVFTQGANADAAKEAGADIVGMDDLAEEVKKGNMDFDVVIASPDAMRVVGAARADSGPARPDAEPQGGYGSAGRGDCSEECQGRSGALPHGQGRYHPLPDWPGGFRGAGADGKPGALMADLNKAKPTSAKGVYIKKVSVSTTMGPGLHVDYTPLTA